MSTQPEVVGRRPTWPRPLAIVSLLAAIVALPHAQRAVLPPPEPDAPPQRGTPPAPAAPQRTAGYTGSIIDAHLHALTVEQLARLGSNADWKWAAQPGPESHLQATLKEMDGARVVLAVISGTPDAITPWTFSTGMRFLPGPMLFDPVEAALPPIDLLQREFASGRWGVLGEIAAQYAGITPDDARLEPYWALAESRSVPVGFHTGTMDGGLATSSFPNFRLRAGNPLLLEDVLVKHPRLRVWLMIGGDAWRQEAFALMSAYPQVYLDIGGAAWAGGPAGRSRLHDFLKEAVARGLATRIMFGSAALAWPQAIGEAIKAVDAAPLNPRVKRAIFFENAKGFFRIADAPG